MKKKLIGFGLLLTTMLPLAAVVSCGDNDKGKYYGEKIEITKLNKAQMDAINNYSNFYKYDMLHGDFYIEKKGHFDAQKENKI